MVCGRDARVSTRGAVLASLAPIPCASMLAVISDTYHLYRQSSLTPITFTVKPLGLGLALEFTV
jgi:hypothetical protein